MKPVDEKRLFDAMAQISEALELLKSARAKLRCIHDDKMTLSVGYNTNKAIESTTDLFNELNTGL